MRIIGLIAAVTVVWWVGTGSRWGHERGHHHRHGHDLQAQVDHVLRAVDATPEQDAAVRAVVARMEPAFARLANERRAVEARLRGVLASDDATTESFAAVAAEGAAVAKWAIDLGVEALAEVGAVLTPEQRVALAEAWDRHR